MTTKTLLTLSLTLSLLPCTWLLACHVDEQGGAPDAAIVGESEPDAGETTCTADDDEPGPEAPPEPPTLDRPRPCMDTPK